jgi:superfamily I DNA and RNA helicase
VKNVKLEDRQRRWSDAGFEIEKEILMDDRRVRLTENESSAKKTFEEKMSDLWILTLTSKTSFPKSAETVLLLVESQKLRQQSGWEIDHN